MKNTLRKALHLTFLGVMLMICITCKKEDNEVIQVKTGDWSGTDISFITVGNPLRISNLEFAYSGHATGTICSFDYESGASFVLVAEVEGQVFSTTLNNFEIEGEFLTDTTAEISIDWTGYDSDCDAHYSGSKVYTASWDSSK